MSTNMKGRNLISINDLTLEEIWQIFELAASLKLKLKSNEPHELLKGKTLGIIFAKPSTRTRVSFEVGTYQLGGTALYLGPNELQLKREETVADTVKVLSRYLNGLVVRTYDHKDAEEFGKYGTIPVINGLTNLLHPCQILSDLFTVYEKRRYLKGLKLAFFGDGNNVCHSLLHGCSKVGIDIYVATPKNYKPNEEIVANAMRNSKFSGSKVVLTEDPIEAAKSADVIYTDTWTSMGWEAEREQRIKDMQPYQVNNELVKHAKEDYFFMHCLPAHRGEEVLNEVADSPNSIIFDEAENRLHLQKAIMSLLM
jgi:ornithine carbamoyltransferase